MQYINRITQQVVSYAEACKLTNTSIPVNQNFGDWKAVKSSEPPVAPEGSHVESDGIKLVDGQYVYAWKVVVTPAAEVVVPTSISRFQAKAQLEFEGFLDDVEAYMSLDTTPRIQKLAWTEAQEFERNSPTVLGLAEILGLTSQDLDTYFIEAKKITA